MSVIDIPDPLPPAISPDREVIEFFIDETWPSSARTTWSPAAGSGCCTAGTARSVTWTGRGSAATGRHQLPPSPPKRRQRSTP